MQDAKPLLLNFGASNRLALDKWTGRVRLVDATFEGMCLLDPHAVQRKACLA